MKSANDFSLGSVVYAAQRATDIVAILRNQDKLGDSLVIAKLNQTLERYGEHSKVVPGDLVSLTTVAEELYAVYAADTIDQAARHINKMLAKYASLPRLSSHNDTAWHLHVDSNDDAPWAEWFAASSALALATLLAEKQQKPGGICAAANCTNPFIDSGKGGERNYCSQKCATRARVAAYRKRAK